MEGVHYKAIADKLHRAYHMRLVACQAVSANSFMCVCYAKDLAHPIVCK